MTHGKFEPLAQKIENEATMSVTNGLREKALRAAQHANPNHKEGELAKTIEKQTSKLPSDFFLWAALGSMGVSLALQSRDKKEASLFVGQWAAPFLVMGLYNKIVKLLGSDR